MIKAKKLLKGEEARLKIKEGIDLVADYTKVTLGPKGRNVALNQFGPLPTRVVNDGVTIANEVKSEDPFVQSGIEMVQEICKKTNYNAGDGTTQTALLAQAIINEGQKRLVAGYNPMDLRRELQDDLEQLLDNLDNLSHKVKSVEDVRNIATISGNNDPEIGNAVADVMDKVGMNASIIIDKGNETSIRTESVKGMWFDKGWRVPIFVNDRVKMAAEYSEPSIFLIDDNIRWADDIMEFFENLLKAGMEKVVIIANEIEGDALYSLALTHKQHFESGEGFNVLAIETPYAGPDGRDALDDIAIYTGAKVISKDTGYELNKVDPREVVGTCDKIIATGKNTTIIGGEAQKEPIQKRIKEIKGLIEQCDPNEKTTREKLENRKDTMESGVGIIYSGGNTEIEIKDRNLRLEDAVLASKSAVKEGFVAGGGLTYLNLSMLAKTDILQGALTKVMAQVAENAGKNAEMVINKCHESTSQEGVGYNAKTDTYENLIKAGVIDATLVVRNALKNSVGLASMFLTTEAIIAEGLEDENKELKLK